MPEVVLTGAAGRIEGRYTQGKSPTAPIALPAGHGMWWAASKTQGRLVPLEGQKQSLAALQVTFSSQIGHTSVSINEV